MKTKTTFWSKMALAAAVFCFGAIFLPPYDWMSEITVALLALLNGVNWWETRRLK